MDEDGRLWICPATESAFVSPVGGSSPTAITGSIATDLAQIVTDLLAELAARGIIVDSTTA